MWGGVLISGVLLSLITDYYLSISLLYRAVPSATALPATTIPSLAISHDSHVTAGLETQIVVDNMCSLLDCL